MYLLLVPMVNKEPAVFEASTLLTFVSLALATRWVRFNVKSDTQACLKLSKHTLFTEK